ncbi:unnamed protein product [Discula destructiva]
MTTAALESIAIQAAVTENRALNFEASTLPEIEIADARYLVVAVHKDIGIQKMGSMTVDQASRISIECIPTSAQSTAGAGAVLPKLKFAAHVFVIGYQVDVLGQTAPTHCVRSEVIVDTDALRAAVDPQPAASHLRMPLCASRTDIQRSSDAPDLTTTIKEKYTAYIGAINERNMAQSLPTYCHDVVIHNGKALPLSEYRQLMEGAQEAIPDLEFSIASLIVDPDRQIVAALLDFRGTPTGKFADVTPPEGGAKEVRFGEIVFYWFKDGKIASVVSLVDLAAYRKQVTGRL